MPKTTVLFCNIKMKNYDKKEATQRKKKGTENNRNFQNCMFFVFNKMLLFIKLNLICL